MVTVPLLRARTAGPGRVRQPLLAPGAMLYEELKTSVPAGMEIVPGSAILARTRSLNVNLPDGGVAAAGEVETSAARAATTTRNGIRRIGFLLVDGDLGEGDDTG